MTKAISLQRIDAVSLRQKAPDDAVCIEHEVPFHDVDVLRVAWHGHYYKYFELGRTALFRKHGLDVGDMRDMNVAFYVIETRARHIAPLLYGERFEIRSWFVEAEPRVTVAYEIVSKPKDGSPGKKCARGRTTLVSITPQGEMLMSTPEGILRKILGPETK